jgi:hypothetical protein
MSKDICIISANCQGAYLKQLLEHSPEFSNKFDVHYFVNYNHEVVPANLLSACKLLIYQPLGSQWGDLSSEYLTAQLPQGAMKLAVNYLTFPLYWPFMAQDSRNIPDGVHPFGQFPYGDSVILSMIESKESPTSIYRKYMDKDFILEHLDPRKTIDDYVSQQRDIESRRDQQLLNFILDHYQETKLFESHNHPSAALCTYQTNDLLKKIGFPKLEKIPDLQHLQIFQQPIHPVVADKMGLRFDCLKDSIYKIWGKSMTFMEYAKVYIDWDVDSIGKIPVPPTKKKVEANSPVNRKPVHPALKGYDGKRQVFFLHIPKTAGSSLNRMLMEAFGLDENYPHFNSTRILLESGDLWLKLPLITGHLSHAVASILRPDPFLFTFLREPVQRGISEFEFMKSHPETRLGEMAQGTICEYYQNPSVREFANNLQTKLLGEELDIGEHYARFIREKLTPEQYFEGVEYSLLKPVDDSVLASAKRRLETIDFFGLTETFDADVPKLFNLLDKPCPELVTTNVTPPSVRMRSSYTQEEIDLVKSINTYDLQLYDFAKELYERKFGN